MLTHLPANERRTRRWPGESTWLRARLSNELDRFEPGWPQGGAEHDVRPAPSASFAWVRAARVAFAESDELQVFTAECDHRLQAVAALLARRRLGVCRLMPPGYELGEPFELAMTSQAGLRCVAEAIVRTRTPLRLDRVPSDSPTIAAFQRAALGRAFVVTRPAKPILELNIDDTWIEPQRHWSLLVRRQWERAQRRANSHGRVSVELHTPDLDELPRLLDAAEGLDMPSETSLAGLQRDDDSLLAARLGRAVFIRQYAEAACMDGALRICLLRIGDRLAAMQIGVESEHTFWLLKSGESPRFARCQPARLLAREVLRYVAESNLSTYAMWDAEQSWQTDWPLVRRACESLDVYPLGVRGLAALMADSANRLAQRLGRCSQRSVGSSPAARTSSIVLP